MGGQTNFFRFGYTSPAGQKFLNMQIDKAGNYHVAKADMQWKYYGQFLYRDTTGGNPDQTVDTTIAFQPYPISDAKGWCGSTLISNPNAVAKMAGQVTFDFALAANVAGVGPTTQIVPGFVMRSYGDYEIDVTTPTGINQHFTGSAVGNNPTPPPTFPVSVHSSMPITTTRCPSCCARMPSAPWTGSARAVTRTMLRPTRLPTLG